VPTGMSLLTHGSDERDKCELRYGPMQQQMSRVPECIS
jgi:hypothetical protein